jgi:hypothetical protein
LPGNPPHLAGRPPGGRRQRPPQRGPAPQKGPPHSPHRTQRHHRARPPSAPSERRPTRRTSHGQLARNNLSTLKGLNAQPGGTVTVRADAGPPPARLLRIADFFTAACRRVVCACSAGTVGSFYNKPLSPKCMQKNVKHGSQSDLAAPAGQGHTRHRREKTPSAPSPDIPPPHTRAHNS